MKGVFATYRPADRDIALLLDDGTRHAMTNLSVPEARAIHGALGLALKLADCADRPLHAVPGANEPWEPRS